VAVSSWAKAANLRVVVLALVLPTLGAVVVQEPLRKIALAQRDPGPRSAVSSVRQSHRHCCLKGSPGCLRFGGDAVDDGDDDGGDVDGAASLPPRPLVSPCQQMMHASFCLSAYVGSHLHLQPSTIRDDSGDGDGGADGGACSILPFLLSPLLSSSLGL
jgi:hypothetical protein